MNSLLRALTRARPGYKYWAFLSYSHEDNVAKRADGSDDDHIRWANWLHEELETFEIPAAFREFRTRTGDPMPERFFPAFRDETELPASHDLTGQIRDALKRSRFLIVIASPRSARSNYVSEEVRYFRELGRGERILTLIVDGEPNVASLRQRGKTDGSECLCPALVHPLRRNGTIDDSRLLREAPLCADVRVRDGHRVRELRCSERDQPEFAEMLRMMKLKLFAGMMGVGADELVQRDRYRLQERILKEEAEREEKLRITTELSKAQSFQSHHKSALGSAQQIQRRFFPGSPPDLAGYNVSAITVPAEHVSGDYFDYLAVDNDHCGIIIADVSNKGVPASLIMAMCCGVVRMVAPGRLSPAETVKAVNAQVYADDHGEMFVTMVYVVVERGNGQLTLCCAGHEAPLLYRAQDDCISSIRPPGLAVGIHETAIFNRTLGDLRLELAPGDCLLLYTDGVTDALDANGDQFGPQRMMHSVRASATNGAPAIMARVIEDLKEFMGTAVQRDDVTLIAIQRQ